MIEHDVREFLRARGAPDTVVAAGFDGLLEQWARTVQHVERGYPFTLDDYLNDLDARQLLDETLSAIPGVLTVARAKRLAELDARMRAATKRRDTCLWGDAIAESSDWNPDIEWWYWAEPVKPGEDLASDLAP